MLENINLKFLGVFLNTFQKFLKNNNKKFKSTYGNYYYFLLFKEDLNSKARSVKKKTK